ncbi:hypothetical protein LPJ77_001563 [Coemansia sp. RSA 2523]|nr:hypothetical protein LPJ54_001134 [Coemansia sp. RSA 1824]KAJ1791938.1 hypothetical protein LPJ62_001124 [Coemansia sp. RSA 2167]KAJ1809546.1 hypothetical protein LPJ77_001563 [Coemansia sp. RSA 2523]
MEYFAKFTRHIGTPRRSPPGGTSQLAQFEKAWKIVQSICYYQSKWRGMRVEKTPLSEHLDVMFDLLVKEDIQQAGSDDWTTGACMEYLLGNGVLEALVGLAETDQPVGARGVVISNLSTFISLTDDKLLVQKAVHNPLLELLHWYGSGETEDGSSPGPSYDECYVDLLYAICSKIRGDPMLLNIFFQDRKWLKSVEQRSFSSDSIAAMMRSIESLRSEGGTATSGFEFLLFSHLLRFVHRDGEVGDTARTSLLFLLELATTEIMASTGGNTALEMFILEDSGFSAILSATLGAMYSQLPRSLRVTTGPAAVIPESFPSYSADLQNAIESSIFSANDQHSLAERWPEDRAPVSSSSPEFRACLSSFASLLSFIQDILYRCPSAHVCAQLLSNLRNNFLQAILYPSLLESSDTDGSSVAVMRYLETMLHVARHEDLASAIMDFLTDEGSANSSASASPPLPEQAAQMSIDNLPETNVLLPFTLRDLVYTNLQSSVSMDAVVTALNLLRLILSKHCRYSSRLIETERVQPSGLANSWMTNYTVAIDIHRQELEMYARLMTLLQGEAEKKDSDSAHMLHIPWRQPTSRNFGERPRIEARMLMPESFTAGYDEYLEDAAQEWDVHQSYHAELDALFAAQAVRDEAALNGRTSSNSKTTQRELASAISPGNQRRMRPRKYSEAVMAPNALRQELRASAPVQSKSSHAGHTCQVKHVRYHIKPSDPIVRALMNLLTKHFAQPRECNLALTGVLAALVGCPYRTLDLWLGFNLPALLSGVLSKPWALWMDNLRSISESSDQESDSDGEPELLQHKRHLSVGGAPATAIAAANAEKYAGLDRELQDSVRQLPSGATSPSLYLVLSGLVQQATVLRNEIPDFSRRLKRARNALMGVVEDVDDLDEELESSSNMSDARSRTRDRGLSSASLENARSISDASQLPEAMSYNVPGSRSRSTSVSTARRMQRPKDTDTRLASDASRVRSNSTAHASEAASIASTANPKSAAVSTTSAELASPGSSWHALNVPPANANLAEFLENVIILQESIKEIVARVQVRRENGGDENAAA